MVAAWLQSSSRSWPPYKLSPVRVLLLTLLSWNHISADVRDLATAAANSHHTAILLMMLTKLYSDASWPTMDTVYSHSYLIVQQSRTVCEKGHTIRRCSTKLHTQRRWFSHQNALHRPVLKTLVLYSPTICLQCFDAVGWAAGRASGLQKTERWVLAWLSVWSEMQTCIRPSWCHCHALSLAPVKSSLVLPFWYRLTWVVLDKGPLNGCVCTVQQSVASTRVQGRGDEPREPTVRLSDWSELVASYSRMKSAWGWANGGQPILVCYIRKYVIILGGYSRWRPPTKILGDVSPASPAALTPVPTMLYMFFFLIPILYELRFTNFLLKEYMMAMMTTIA